MAEVAERHYLDAHGVAENRLAGLAVTRRGYGRPTRLIRVIEAGHPVPDAAGLAATLETLALADTAGPDDLVLVLISGGASANWIAPAAGLTLSRKAGGDARAAALRRLDRRDQHRAQASLPHQGRTARRARASGAPDRRRHLRRAGRRSERDRLRSDRARSHHAGGRPRHRGALSARAAGDRDPRPRRRRQRDAEARRRRVRPHGVRAGNRGPPTPSLPRRTRPGRRATSRSCSAPRSKARRATSPPPTHGWRATSRPRDVAP